MADLSQTTANVAIAAAGATTKIVQVGETVAEGMPGYLKAADLKYWKADADTAAEANAEGIFLTPATTDGYAVLQTGGSINVGATLTVGESYCVSTNVGAIAPIGDLTTGDFVTILGTATAAGVLPLNIYSTGVAKP